MKLWFIITFIPLLLFLVSSVIIGHWDAVAAVLSAGVWAYNCYIIEKCYRILLKDYREIMWMRRN